LEGVWEEELVPLLQRAPALTPITLLEHLQRKKPDVDWIPVHRTLQRREREWKVLHGSEPPVSRFAYLIHSTQRFATLPVMRLLRGVAMLAIPFLML
jgi:hypothetical protein